MKFDWRIDYLIVGFIVQNILLLIIIIDLLQREITNWQGVLLLLIPEFLWGLELAKTNLQN